MGYLTPNIVPDRVICRALFIPDNEEYLAIVRGALQELTFSYNWTKFGALTPDEAAQNFVDMFDKFCFGIGVCRMIGEIVAYAGATSPTDKWLVCDGSEVPQADYPDLYAVIGTTYGSASIGMFRLPDLQGRSPAGSGSGTGLSAVSVGSKYGEENHTLSILEMPSHSHTYIPPVFNVDIEAPGAPDPVAAGIGLPTNTYDTGGGQAHNTIGPRLGVNFLIVAKD